MTAYLDTSVVVRYLTGQPPEQYETALAIVDADEQLVVTDVVLAEAAWVLRSTYAIDRTAIVDGIISFIRKENITILGLDTMLVIDALKLCRPSNRISVVDALIWAVARSTPDSVVYSFDRRFPADGVTVLAQR